MKETKIITQTMRFEIPSSDMPSPEITFKRVDRYTDCTVIRLHNRRVIIEPIRDEEYGLTGYSIYVRFISLKDPEPYNFPNCSMTHVRGKCWESMNVFREETAVAMGYAVAMYQGEKLPQTWTYNGKTEEE